MISLQEVLPIAGVAVDVVLIALVGALMHRLTRDPTRVWREREARLGEIHDSLRLLVGQAEGQARSLDAGLADHARRLRELLDEAAAVRTNFVPPRERPRERPVSAPTGRAEPSGGRLRKKVAELSGTGLDPQEIADRLDVPLAEIRLLVGLEQSARERAQAAYMGGKE